MISDIAAIFTLTVDQVVDTEALALECSKKSLLPNKQPD